jgi:pyruvate kinase
MKIDPHVQLLKYRRTKIIATVGTASNDRKTLEKLMRAGVDVFRLNMSHGTHQGHRAAIDDIRIASQALEKPVAIMADLSGPKIRVGVFEGGGIHLEAGSSVTVTTRTVTGREGLIPSQYPALAQDVMEGSRILLDDGNLEIRVAAVNDTEIDCQVVVGGRLSDHKGMNLPGVAISAPSLTRKDREDARFILDLGVDLLALSFVRREKDILDLRDLVERSGRKVAIVSKIEKPEALENIDDILTVSDAVMVARGDLGVELSPEHVPVVQDQLIDLARHHRKPVIIATQMLETMIHNPRPTRAEVSDVANAVRFGADAIMLSGETAVGRHPETAVIMMDHIARQTEGTLWQMGAFETLSRHDKAPRPVSMENAVAESTAKLSRDLMVRAIAVISQKDRSAAIMSASRPACPIVSLSSNAAESRIENLMWGVIPVIATEGELRDPRSLAGRVVTELGLLADESHTILLVQGFSGRPEEHLPNITVIRI